VASTTARRTTLQTTTQTIASVPPVAYVALTGHAPAWVRIWLTVWVIGWVLGVVFVALITGLSST
jgi:hypothetical protein